jgi:hypothetical protein
MNTPDSQNQKQTNPSDAAKTNQPKNQTQSEKDQEQKLTEDDVNPSKEEKKTIDSKLKIGQSMGNKNAKETTPQKPQSNNTDNSQKNKF